MKKTQTKKIGFTLIELLVVIAIIGILAGLLFPAISGAMKGAQGLKVGNNGRSIVMAIISANTDRESMNLGSVWPSKTSTFASNDGSETDYTSKKSTEYFKDLIVSKAVEDLSWSIFAGGGIAAASNQSDFETGNYNVWSMIAGLDDSTASDTPVFFTKNLKIEATDLQSASGTAIQDWTDKLDGAAKPFGNSIVAMVTTGGSMNTIKGKYFKNSKLFMGGSMFDGSSTNKDAAVCRPGND